MGLPAILEKIRAAGEAQIQGVETNTLAQVSEILAQVRLEAQQIDEDACANASAPAVAERARILHRARSESLRIVGDVRENLVDTALTRAHERLTTIRADPCYLEVFRTLTKEALAELASDTNAKLLADPRDEKMLKNILNDLKLDLPVSYELNCCGGLIAKSADGRVVVINTFEARMERAMTFLRHHLAALFEEEQTPMKDMIHA
jgi:vacuolar-type H+-ATPase subunit E/Vma4